MKYTNYVKIRLKVDQKKISLTVWLRFYKYLYVSQFFMVLLRLLVSTSWIR